MSAVLKISEAASLAMHAMVYLAAEPDRRVSSVEIATTLGVSEAHLSKVFQRLVKAGLVDSARGRSGGFTLVGSAQKITLLKIYEAMEGPLVPTRCLLGKPICRGNHCILGGLLDTVDTQVRGYLARTRLAKLTGAYRSAK